MTRQSSNDEHKPHPSWLGKIIFAIIIVVGGLAVAVAYSQGAFSN